MFFVSMMAGLLVFQAFGSPVAGLVGFLILSIGARLLTREDSQMLVVVFAAIQRKRFYDAGR